MAQRAAKAAAKASELDARWIAEVDESIKSIIDGGVSFRKIASKLGKGLSSNMIQRRWYDHLKKSSGNVSFQVALIGLMLSMQRL